MLSLAGQVPLLSGSQPLHEWKLRHHYSGVEGGPPPQKARDLEVGNRIHSLPNLPGKILDSEPGCILW